MGLFGFNRLESLMAFDDSIGAILSQEGQPIAYESFYLHKEERTLGIYEKELLAVIHALDSW